MNTEIIYEKQDLTYLSWSLIRSSSGTAGSFLKATSELGSRKIYYKLSNYDSVSGIIGHECVNELIADRLPALPPLQESCRDLILGGLDVILPQLWLDKILEMLSKRWEYYADLCNQR